MLGKVFKAYDIRGIYPNPLSEQIAWKIGYGTGKFLLSQLPGRDSSDPMLQHVVVGQDMRKSSPATANALIAGLRVAGMNVIDLGMVDTSFIYFAVNYLKCGGGVQTTASHNPAQYNGFKISGLDAKPIGSQTGLEEIKRIAATAGEDEEALEPVGRLEKRDLWAAYKDHVLSFLDAKNLKRKLKVVVDASNGMAGKFVPPIFGDLPNVEIIPLNFEITGTFNHDPNPLVPENMVPTQEAVREHGADLGVCFDGDADRCMVTDEKGDIVGCDLMGALMAGHFIETFGKSPILYDLRSSRTLPDVVKELGCEPIRSRVGHVFMKAAMREHDAVFGAELSGHMYYRDNFYADSGAMTFSVILEILGNSDKTFSELIKPFQRYTHSGEINFEVDDKAAKIAEIQRTFGGEGMVDDLDGITIDAMDELGWWFNVRQSNTEPLLRLNLEAKDASTYEAIKSRVMEMLGEPLVGH